jgi:hypothetical protein
MLDILLSSGIKAVSLARFRALLVRSISLPSQLGITLVPVLSTPQEVAASIFISPECFL